MAMTDATVPDADAADGGTKASFAALLAAAGLPVPDDEVERLAQLYPDLRASVDRFYAVDVGDEVPAAVFRADDGAQDSAVNA